ncbi:DUF1847 domain-containing protein [Desulfotomaculum copahuensis]|uniref:Metal-binding protein n=1 Tax=Desulfotomaculum copahuensis TaxID=1838280 RepID=A0A1B7LCI4_9FIRM|nr:DUF1847 domain-containing protein [Desulfotomaculum copahuensis]OAT80439.1 hypothetical protein A6M21_00760 [Desulfotomaculum copahuensis]
MPDVRSRLEELIDFCHEVGYRHLGLVFCCQLEREAHELARILKRHFTVETACCRLCPSGSGQLARRRVTPGEKRIFALQELIAYLNCSPVELHVDTGLCAGPDIVLQKHSPVPVTTLAVRDPLLGHDPLGALNSPAWRQKFGLK